MQKVKKHGLVGDIWPLVRLMRVSGMWMLEYYEEPGGALRVIREGYALFTSTMVISQFVFIFLFLLLDSYDGDQMASGTITFLFFAHSITKYVYFALRARSFYRVLGAWNQVNSHPLFAESNARHRARALKRMRKLMTNIGLGTLCAVFCWTTVTFVGPSTRAVPDTDTNQTVMVEVPRLMIGAHYFWDASEGYAYIMTFGYQLYYLLFSLSHANILDVMFCCLVIFACEQLKHLKEIMRPLMELSAALDTAVPNVSSLFRIDSTASDKALIGNEDDPNSPPSYNDLEDFVSSRYQGRNGVVVGPNALTKKQEMLVRSAIKYWVERHKHVVKYTSLIGDAYGAALLMHMLISTVTLTLLSYQATKIDGFDLFSIKVLGYLFYTLAQVFVFCIHGNELIEESSSVMEAAYSCHWYDGSEEAKTFIQIVCQQCQKSLTVSGAKFFTVSLDLFASVLGAVVTYFMVLIQLK